MTPPNPHPHFPFIQSPLAARLSWTVQTIREAIARARFIDPAKTRLIVFAFYRLGFLLKRLDAIVVKWQAGTLPTPRPARPRKPRPAPPDPDTLTPEQRLRRIRPWSQEGITPREPRARSWLVKLFQPTGIAHAPVADFLNSPDCLALLRDAPQAGRILRPLARMFGIQHALLDLPKRARKPTPKPEIKPQSRPRDARDLPGPWHVPRKWRLEIPKRNWNGGDRDWEKSG